MVNAVYKKHCLLRHLCPDILSHYHKILILGQIGLSKQCRPWVDCFFNVYYIVKPNCFIFETITTFILGIQTFRILWSATVSLDTYGIVVACQYFQNLDWLVGCFGFNGPLRQYFSLYRAVSQREGERRERIDESKNVQTTPTRTYCKRNRPLPYCNQNCRTPRHWKFTQDPRTTRPPPQNLENNGNYSACIWM